MDRKQRVIWSDNGTLIDISAELNDYTRGSKVLPLVASQDKIYIGSELPFNHKYIDISVANDVASVVSIEIWTGSGWVAAVDVKDETAINGVTLAQSGMISFARDIDKSGWICERDTQRISELSTLRIFNLYWCRLSFSVSLKSTTALNYIGQRFSDDINLYIQYPLFNNERILTSYKAGKTDWKEQSFNAAEIIVRDLRAKGIVVRRDQILDSSLYTAASVHKTAAIIFAAMGNGYRDAKNDAEEYYQKNLNIKFHEVDLNADGETDGFEKTFSVGFGYR